MTAPRHTLCRTVPPRITSKLLVTHWISRTARACRRERKATECKGLWVVVVKIGGARVPTESQLHDAALRVFIRQRLEDGLLPLLLTKTIAVHWGAGGECAACGQTITDGQIEYQAFGPHYGVPLRLHWGCHVLWQLECVAQIRGSSASTRCAVGQG